MLGVVVQVPWIKTRMFLIFHELHAMRLRQTHFYPQSLLIHPTFPPPGSPHILAKLLNKDFRWQNFWFEEVIKKILL
jgi:hypothetical protein